MSGAFEIKIYDANGILKTSGVNAIAFSPTPTGIFDSSVSISAGVATITLSLDNQSGNSFLASPSGGGAGSPAFRAIDDTDLPVTLDGHTITNGTMDGTAVGTVTPDTGYFSAIREYIGGFYAAITHAFTGNHTVTIPGDADVTLVGVDTVQTLTNKTLTTPTIGSFTNATHNHQNAAGGGTLDAAAIASGTLSNSRVNFAAPGDIGTTTPAKGWFSELKLKIGGFLATFSHAFTADHTVTIPGDADVTLVGVATTQTLTGKTLTSPTINTPVISGGTIDNTAIGATTRNVGYFSALREYIGGFAAIFTHANSADRTYTLPDATTTLVGTDTTQTLTGKTLTTPTIASFANANHNHQDSAGGGTLDAAAIASGTLNNSRVNFAAPADIGGTTPAKGYFSDLREKIGGFFAIFTHANSADRTYTLPDKNGTVAMASDIAITQRNTPGLILRKLDNATLYVNPGVIEVNGTVVEKTALTKLGMATNGDWIGGTSNEAASSFAWVYIDASGNIKLHNKAPNAPTPAAAIATMLVNQVTWIGTAGLGLNATATIYDNDTGEGSVTEGMLALIYASTDSDYSLGRGRGSAAAGNNNDVSAALITAISTGGAGGTITFEAGHNIAIRDNDRIAVVPYGALCYRQESGTWYRLIGAMYNNASSNLEENRHENLAYYIGNEASNWTSTSLTMVDVDSTNLSLTILSRGLPALLHFTGSLSTTAGVAHMDATMDAVIVAGDDGFVEANSGGMIHFTHLFNAVLPGTHTWKLQYEISGAGTITLYAGAGSAGFDIHPQFSVVEIGEH